MEVNKLTMLYLIVFLVGASIASFAFSYAERRKRLDFYMSSSKQYDSCKENLYKNESISIFPYLFFRGRCIFCKEKINLKRSIFEFFGGLLSLFSFIAFDAFKAIILSLALITSLLISLNDLENMEVYDTDLYLLIGLGIVFRFLYLGFDYDFFKISIIFTLIFLLIRLISQGGIGDGDLFFYLALFLFLEDEFIVWFLLISIWIAAVYAITKAIRQRSLKGQIPLVPSILLAFVLIVFLKEVI